MSRLSAAVLLGLVAGVAWVELHTGPPAYNSDQAIPVLMANARSWDLFHAFFYGEDRFGAWPFLAAHLLSLGRVVTIEGLDAWALLFVLLGVIPATVLGRPSGGLAYLVAFLVPSTRLLLTEVCQPYCWQVPIILWAWMALRAALEKPSVLRRMVALGLCMLATWLATTSGPMLLALVLVELRAAGNFPKRSWVLALPLAGIVAEAVLRVAYHRFALAHYGQAYETPMHLDLGHLGYNLEKVFRKLLASGAILPLAIALRRLAPSKAKVNVPGSLEERQASANTLGLTLLALINLPVLVLLDHVRANGFADRYFAPTSFFAVMAALTAVGSWLRAHDRRFFAGLSVAAAVLAVIPRHAVDLTARRKMASVLAQKGPGAYVLDSYWNVYTHAALAPPGALIPLPQEGDQNRMPWVTEGLRAAPAVFVGDKSLLPKGQPPPQHLTQYGVELELQQADFVVDGERRFALYTPVEEQN